MRALVTGASGFVGRYLCAFLAEEGDDVVAADSECDVTDQSQVTALLSQHRLDVVYHLAARTHVGESFEDPVGYTKVNVVGTKNVLDAVRASNPEALTVLVSSSDVYGAVASSDLPVNEVHRVTPVSPYATSKLEAEHLAHEVSRTRHQRVIIARPFNHIGPGQAPTFVVPALATRLLEAARAGAASVPVGDLSTRRDFTDVRDVVRAYRLLAQHGRVGETYNIASGHDTGIDDIAEQLRATLAPDVAFVRDERLVRPIEVPVLRGDVTKLHDATGWEPRLTLRESLDDIVKSLTASA